MNNKEVSLKHRAFFIQIFIFGFIFCCFHTYAQETMKVGETGFGVKKPVMAAACENGCPWGELGDFVKESMAPSGYEVILCRNCNANLGPGLVSKAGYPPELNKNNIADGIQRVDAPVDFGVTASDFLSRAFFGEADYTSIGPLTNLRLIAKIEDPFYLLVAVKAESGITNLAQIREKRLPVRVLCMGSPITQPILEYYGITRKDLESWGGSMGNEMAERGNGVFDVIINDIASPANNPESDYWTAFSYKYNLHFIELPDELLSSIIVKVKGTQLVTVKWGLLKGVDRKIKTVGRSGNSVFARYDTPEQASYDIAKAIDINRAALKWFIRPYSYDSRTVWKNDGVPLHPGAERYYREMGYIH
jgi:TRAP-type uncharacterized transport system substrate-binding protein